MEKTSKVRNKICLLDLKNMEVLDDLSKSCFSRVMEMGSQARVD